MPYVIADIRNPMAYFNTESRICQLHFAEIRILKGEAMYEIFERLLKERNVTATEVSRATGVPRSSFTDWKKGRSTPKADKLQKIADYFGVPLETFTSDGKRRIVAKFHAPAAGLIAGKPTVMRGGYDKELIAKELLKAIDVVIPEEPEGYPVYYTDEETARAAQEVFDNPETRMLFDAARDARPEDIRLAAEMLKRFKGTNPDG